MPPIPTGEGDWYIIVPLQELTEPDQLQGAAQVFVVQTTDSDLAAQVAYDNGFPRCLVIIGTYYEEA